MNIKWILTSEFIGAKNSIHIIIWRTTPKMWVLYMLENNFKIYVDAWITEHDRREMQPENNIDLGENTGNNLK